MTTFVKNAKARMLIDGSWVDVCNFDVSSLSDLETLEDIARSSGRLVGSGTCNLRTLHYSLTWHSEWDPKDFEVIREVLRRYEYVSSRWPNLSRAWIKTLEEVMGYTEDKERETVILKVDDTKKETEKAFLFEIDGEEKWVPKSQISNVDDVEEGFSGDVEVSAWFAEKEGIS